MSKPLSNRLTIIYKTSISRTEWEAVGGGGCRSTRWDGRSSLIYLYIRNVKDIYTRSLSLSDPRTAKQSRFGIHNENKQAEQCDLYKKIMNYITMSSLYIPRSHLNWFTEALPYIFWSISCKHKVKAIGTWQHIVKYMFMLQVFHIILKMYDNFR